MMHSDNPTLAEKLATAIADGILNGTLRPGLRLDETGLAQQHGVSRTPVREALRQLTMSGLIDMRPRKGAIVSKATPEQVESLFVAMAEMEATCARLAAMSMTPVERRRLQARHEAMTALAGAGDPDAYSNANVAFHSAIYAGAHNAPIAEYTLGLRRRVGPFRRAQFQVEGRLTKSNQEHDAVVRAILSGDAAGAHAAMLHHVGLVEDAFEAFAGIKVA
ncbi:MAG: GntR family transcriptional regulator [Alphaproteobacteria bacterium]|nr:GntR family transcriptional regulator [Alphaproteobacteria bacterium]